MFHMFFLFLPCYMAYGILVPQPGIKPGALAVRRQVLTTGQPGNCHVCFLTRSHMDPMIAPIINSVFFTWILLLTQFYSKENWSSVREWLLPKCPMLADSSVCVCVCVSQLCPTLRNPMDCNLPGSSVHGILQARILEWVAMSFSRADSKAKF